MPEELKIRIKDYRKMEEHIKKLGATFRNEINATDTYFSQPEDEVLKLTEDDTGNHLLHLKAKDGKFGIVANEKIGDVAKTKDELNKKFGIKTALKKKRRFFDFPGLGNININLIEGVGEFLIIESASLNPEIITGTLQIKNPEFITVSFDKLKRSK